MEQKKSYWNLLVISLVIIIILLISLIILVVVQKDSSGLSNQNTNELLDKATLSKEEALDIALKDIQTEKADVHDISIELERKYGKVVYEIDFDYQYYEYEYYIDATTGEILHSFKEYD